MNFFGIDYSMHRVSEGVTNSAGYVDSSVTALDVGNKPSITQQPSPQTVPSGSTATFTANASSSATMTYQWYKGTSSLSGKTSKSLTISNVQLFENAGFLGAAKNDITGFKSGLRAVDLGGAERRTGGTDIQAGGVGQGRGVDGLRAQTITCYQ